MAPASAASLLAAGTAIPTMEDWRAVVTRDGRPLDRLASETPGGLPVFPLHMPRRDTVPLAAAHSARWTIVEAIDAADPGAGARIREAAEGGAGMIALRLPEGPLPDLAALAEAAAPLALRIEPHPRAAEAADGLVSSTGTPIAAFGLDPLSDDPPALFRRLSASARSATLVECDGRPFHEAGASEAEELAAIVAALAEALRALEASGIAPAEALPRIGVSLAVDCDQFTGIARLRAARLLTARLAEIAGAPASPLRIHAETSRRMTIRAEPSSNLLRNTIAAFAAVAGGADTLAVRPHTGPADAGARRLARNVQHLLADESHAHALADPGAGSGTIEALTDALCGAAWEKFRRIEAEGGLRRSLARGLFTARIAASRERLAGLVRSGALPLVGATIYRAAEAEPSGPATPAPATGPLAPVRLEDFGEAAPGVGP